MFFFAVFRSVDEGTWDHLKYLKYFVAPSAGAVRLRERWREGAGRGRRYADLGVDSRLAYRVASRVASVNPNRGLTPP